TYQFGLHWFMRLFNDALVTCLRANSGKARLASLTSHFTTMFYANVSRSLFDEDKLPFAVMMMVRFLEASGYATKDEANLLLYGRATDSTYTAKPTFMRLASGRSGLGRTPPRRTGGAASRGTSVSGLAPAAAAAAAAARRSPIPLRSAVSGGGAAGGGGQPVVASPTGRHDSGGGGGAAAAVGMARGRSGEQQPTSLEVLPEEVTSATATGDGGGDAVGDGGGGDVGGGDDGADVELVAEVERRRRTGTGRTSDEDGEAMGEGLGGGVATPAAPHAGEPFERDEPLEAVLDADSARESPMGSSRHPATPVKPSPLILSEGQSPASQSDGDAGVRALTAEISLNPGTAPALAAADPDAAAAAAAAAAGDPFGGMFLKRRGKGAADGGGGDGVPPTPSRLARAFHPSSADAETADAADVANGPFEGAVDAADAAFFAAAAGDAAFFAAAAAAPPLDGGLVPPSPGISAALPAAPPSGSPGRNGPFHSQRLSGLLPSLLSNDASAPAYLPDELRPDWLPDESWSRLRDLGKLQPYNRVLPALLENYPSTELLRKYYDNLSCLENPSSLPSQPPTPLTPLSSSTPAPDPLEPPHPRLAELNTFQRLLLVRCLQPRGFVAQAQAAVREYLGPACVSNEQLVDFEAIFAVTEATMPIVLISSTDHTLPFLQQFADSRGISVMHMAIGRGQGAATDRLIRSAVSMDRWVILENSHLAGDWMPSLCRLVQALPLLKPHVNFRLWLTTVPTSAYPDIILQSSLKLVMDPPHGIKANLLQVMSQLPVEVASNSRYAQQLLPSYGAERDSNGDIKSGGDDVIGRKVTILPPDWKQLVLRLCLFHAMLTERLQYRSLGWRRPYEFTAADMLSAMHQVLSIVHVQPVADIDASLPGLLHVVGQCLYGGKVTHDWDRRLLVCLLSQQLQPSEAVAAATLETLLPERLSGGSQDLSVVAKEVRNLAIPREDPRLVGLSPGAASVRSAQYTRHVLDTLKRVHLLRSTDEVDLTKPLQLALSVCQDLLKQLPLSPIPGTRSAWAAMVGGSGGRSGSFAAVFTAAGKPGSARGGQQQQQKRSEWPWSSLAAPGEATPPRGSSTSVGGGTPAMSPKQAAEAAAREQLQRAAAAANSSYLPRYKAGKMTEEMSAAALERWEAMHPTMQRAMVQVFNDEVASFATMLNTVHAAIRSVNAAIKGYEGVSEAVAELVQQLSQGHVPRAWLHQRVELQSDNIATWLSDLQVRLEFLYDWAVEGPPLAVPLGMLSRPRSFLTAVQQSFAERLGRPVGQVFMDTVLLQEDEEQMLPSYRLPQLGTKALASTPLTAADGGTLMLGTALSEGCLISGLVLQGARWDRSRRALADPEPGVLHSGMPLLWLRATTNPAVPQLARALALPGATVPTRINDSYVCPVFKFVAGFGGRNTNLLQGDADDCLTTVLLPCGGRKAEYWAAHNVVVVAVPDPTVMLEAAVSGSAMASERESTAGTPGAGGGGHPGSGPAW
ncbi:hypothetical protein PLESTM_002066000, partial [Pleodorina starrii]